jgi:DNA repair exonuclease SbcCD nuclease subunit
MKDLLVGDVHAKVEDLDDCRRLRSFIMDVARKESPDRVIFLGDQYDAHAIVHVEVQRFWLETFDELITHSLCAGVYAIVGNHDRPGNAASTAHSMQVHGRERVHVVDRPFADENTLFLPYYHDSEQMVRAAADYPDRKVLYCHATFDGAKYDNGFYAKEAVSPDRFPQQLIISGHIHTPGRFGKVWYPGSPRWQTLSDANVSRAINVASFSEDGGLDSWTPYSTDKVCRRVWQFLYTPEDRCEKEFALTSPGDRITINIQGPQEFCDRSKRSLQAPGVRIKTFPTDRAKAKLSESEGVPAAFRKHFESYKPKHGTQKDILRSLLQERLHVARAALQA